MVKAAYVKVVKRMEIPGEEEEDEEEEGEVGTPGRIGGCRRYNRQGYEVHRSYNVHVLRCYVWRTLA